MEIIQTTPDMQARAAADRRRGLRIGLVPTMGFLHEGHLSLIELARNRCDLLVTSIFVNPTQFGPNEDLDAYPRDFDRDERLCRNAGTDIVFYPAPDEMYARDATVFVDENRLSLGLCGRTRDGHFRGVLTVVAKLFNIVQPDIAVFGRKDAQQLRLIQRMVRDLNFPIEIVAGETVREKDGVAMSSRNAYLSKEARPQAVCLRQALDLAETLYRNGEREASTIKQKMSAFIGNYDAAKIDYIEIVEWDTLQPVDIIDRPCLVALAVHIGSARLIDNTLLT